MATELAKAYVQIIPSARGISGEIQKTLDPEATSAGTSFGSKLVGTMKKVLAAAAIGKALKASIMEGADLEQSLGGIETLFKDSADKVKANAAKAYKTAGMSANEYMELTTSFSASLLSSLSNDTSKAADVADMAMTDMSDNANKMGTNMEDIKNAYQGFAKQNYTMLDNLKLGYGGTKSEMERLLADAQKISGTKYDINNLSDVYNAIHVIQGQLDITGTTAKEAATTISGSFNSMKAAAKNVMGEIALGMDVGPALEALGETTITFFAGNLLPAVSNVLSALPNLIAGVTSIISRIIYTASNNIGAIAKQGGQIVLGLAASILENAPFLVREIINLIAEIGKTLINTDWGAVGQNIINELSWSIDVAAMQILGVEGNKVVETLLKAISEQLPLLENTANEVINNMVGAIDTQLPHILFEGSKIIENLVNGILQSLPTLILGATTLMQRFVAVILLEGPAILQAGADLILNLIDGIIKNLPKIAGAAATAIAALTATIGKNLPVFLQKGIEIIGRLAAGLIRAIPSLIGQIPAIISAIRNAFSNTDWHSIGRNIIQGIANGLKNAAHMLWDAVKGVLGNFKDKVLEFFGIRSPARWGVYVGEMIDRGFAKGIVGNLPIVSAASDALATMATGTISSLNLDYAATGGNANETGTETINRLDILIALLRMLINKNPDDNFSNRELVRALKDMGVVFA